MNIQQIIDLYQQGILQTEIAKRCNCTRQNISLKIRKYYSQNPTFREYHFDRFCPVCRNTYRITERKDIMSLCWVNIKPEIIKIRVLCKNCKDGKLYRCSCGRVDVIKPDFHIMQGDPKNHHVLCNKCNAEHLKQYFNNYPDKRRMHNKKNRNWQKNNRDLYRSLNSLYVRTWNYIKNKFKYRDAGVMTYSQAKKELQTQKIKWIREGKHKENLYFIDAIRHSVAVYNFSTSILMIRNKQRSNNEKV